MFPRKDDLLSKRMSTEFVRSNSWTTAWQNMMPMYQTLPALRAFYPMNTYIDRGVLADPRVSAIDLGGAAYHLHVSPIGKGGAYTYPPEMTLYRGITPVIPNFYVQAADNHPGLNLTGKTIIGGDRKGLTIGLWMYTDVEKGGRGTQWFMCKGDSQLKNNQYSLNYSGDTYDVNFIIANDPDFDFIPSTGEPVTPGKPHFIVGRFTYNDGDPGNLSLFVDGKKWSKTSTLAEIGQVSNPLHLQHSDGSYPMDGWLSMAFVSACAIPDAIIMSLYHSTRPYYGVK